MQRPLCALGTLARLLGIEDGLEAIDGARLDQHPGLGVSVTAFLVFLGLTGVALKDESDLVRLTAGSPAQLPPA